MNILGYELKKTCAACPESYEVFLDGKEVGYLRLRHGYFRAEHSGEAVYESHPEGDGIFEDHEREQELTNAIEAIARSENRWHH